MKREDPHRCSELHPLTIDAEDDAGKQHDKVLDFFWRLFRHYCLQEVRTSANSKLVEDLLKWLQRKIPRCDVKDLSTSWQDARCYLHLCEALRPGCLAQEKLSLADLSARTPLQNAMDALRVAKNRLGIRRLLTPEDLIEGEPRSTCVYLMQFHKFWADLNPAEANLLPARTLDPSKCRAFGEGLEPAVSAADEAHQFFIEAVNVFGQTLRRGGAKFTVDIQLWEHDSSSLIQQEHDTSSIARDSDSYVTYKDHRDGLYLVTYVPRKVGVHTISVSLDGKPILSSPWTVLVPRVSAPVSRSVSPSDCVMTGPGLARRGKQKHTFTIHPRDAQGKRIRCPPARFSVSVTHCDSQESVRVIVAEPERGSVTIAVEYFPTKIGSHTISVTLDSQHHINGSPCRVCVTPSQTT